MRWKVPAALALGFVVPSAAAPSVASLAAGDAVRIAAAPEAPAVLVVATRPGRPWVALVEQDGVELRVEVADPAGGEPRVVDGPFEWPPERVFVEPEEAGAVELRIAPAREWSDPVEVAVTVVDLAAATAGRLDAERAESRARAALGAGAMAGEAAADAAERFAEAALRWNEAGETGEEAWALLAQALLLRLAGRPPDALLVAERAAERFRLAGERRGEGHAVAESGRDHDAIGDVAAAAERFAAARDLLAGVDPAGAAAAGYHLCMSSLRAGELASGLACVEASIAGFRAGGALVDLAAALATAGRAYDLLTEPDRAFAAYEESLALARRVGSPDLEAKALNNLAALHSGLGEIGPALALYDQALAAFRETGNRLWEVRVLHNLGTNYLLAGDLHRARLLLEEALAGRIETGNRDGEAGTRNVLGRVLHLAGDHAAALERQREALAIWRQQDSVPGQVWALLAIARTARRSGDVGAAAASVAEAERVLAAAGEPVETPHLLFERGQTRLAGGDIAGALADLAAAAERSAVERSPWDEAQALAALADALVRDGRPAEAESRLAAAVERIETARLQVPGSELRATFLGRWREIYEEWIDVLMTLHAEDPGAGFDRRAFAVAERARARSLSDLLARAGAAVDEAVAPELRERRLALRRRVAAKAARLAARVGGGDAQAVADAERELYETVAALERLEAEIHAAEPRLAALEAPPTADAAGLAGRLAADELLVEVSLGEARSFAWSIGRGGVTSWELPGRAEVETRARALHEAASRRGGAADAEARRATADLAAWLLPSGRVPDGVRRLLVVPDGALHYLPFALLPAAGGGDGGEGERLVARYDLVTLPSASALVLAGGGRAPEPGHRLAALADPVFDAADFRVAAAAAGAAEPPVEVAALRGGGGALHRLRHTRREIETIAALAPPGEVLVATDFEADRELVLSGALDGYRVVHFATHGVLDGEHPELSGLVLSQVDADGSAKNGFLRLRDVYGLDLAADLVVLSGCQTALGREVRGEGLVGLTRGFLYAGVEQVLASLWRVEDRATAELMERFYRALWLDGLPPAAALARAQRQLAADPRWSDPYYWAAFIVQGALRRPDGAAVPAPVRVAPVRDGRR